jgi:hypothetical protein
MVMASGHAQAEGGVVTVAQKEQHGDRKSREKGAKAMQVRALRDGPQQEQQRPELAESAPRSATSAFERGDQVFQLFLELADTRPLETVAGATIPGATGVLNSVCSAGWEMVSSSLITGTRNAPLHQDIAGSSIIAYYLFRRGEENLPALGSSSDIAGIDHVCPHCSTRISTHETVCSQCRWWRSLDDATRGWRRQSEALTSSEQGS